MSDQPVPPDLAKELILRLERLIHRTREAEVATLAAALLNGRQKAISINQMLDVVRDINFAKFPAPNNPDYQEWVKTKDERLNRVFK